MFRVAFLLLAAAACRPTGSKTPVPPAKPPTLVLCKTTEQDLRSALGEPTRNGLYHDQHVMSWIIEERTVVSYLAVLLDGSGVVIDEIWNIPSEIPWIPTDQCAKRTTPPAT